MTCWSKHGDIFGSPPEPHFNHKGSGVSSELLQEWLLIIADKNVQRMKRTNMHKGCGLYKMNNVAEFVFLTCEKLKMPPEAKYLTIEIFDGFMLKHIKDLYKHALESRNKLKWKYWLSIQDRIKNQMLLRIISCCQIASKLTSHYKVVGINRTRRFLAESGHHYTADSILQSEMRVLKTLEFNVFGPTPLTYIELLLEVLGHNDPDAKVKIFHEITTKVLDMVYFNYNEVYKRLYQFASCKHAISVNDRFFTHTPSELWPLLNLENFPYGLNPPELWPLLNLENFPNELFCIKTEHSEKINCVKADYMLLAVSVITTSCYIVDQLKADNIIDQLSKIARVPKDDIIDFATVLVQMILETS